MFKQTLRQASPAAAARRCTETITHTCALSRLLYVKWLHGTLTDTQTTESASHCIGSQQHVIAYATKPSCMPHDPPTPCARNRSHLSDKQPRLTWAPTAPHPCASRVSHVCRQSSVRRCQHTSEALAVNTQTRRNICTALCCTI